MKLLATLQGNNSATELVVSNIPSEYVKIIVKGAVRMATGGNAKLNIKPNNSNNFTTNYINSYDVNILSWSFGGDNVTSGIRPNNFIPRSSDTTGAHLHFEIDFANRADSRQKIALGWASHARTSSEQVSGLFLGDMETTSTFNSISFTNTVSEAFSSSSIIHVYGVK